MTQIVNERNFCSFKKLCLVRPLLAMEMASHKTDMPPHLAAMIADIDHIFFDHQHQN